MLLAIFDPTKPPSTPPGSIYSNIDKSRLPNPVVNMSNIRADSWEKKIIKIELSADSLAFIEKHSASIATLNGPPPIPRNAANTPKINPNPTNIKILFIQYVIILLLRINRKTYCYYCYIKWSSTNTKECSQHP